MDKIKILESSIQRLVGLLEVDREVMDADDIGDLQSTIDGLSRMLLEYNRDKYVEQLLQFKDYLDVSVTTDNEKDFTEWTEKQYTITHDGHSVVIDNGAEVYNHLTDMLQDEIDNWQ